MKFLKIIALAVAAAISYGIIHDQITARICVEYFTIGHPPVFPTQNPTLLAFGWGVIATWWVGVFLGVPLALCARLGSYPVLGPKQLLKPIGTLLLVMAVAAFSSGAFGYWGAKTGVIAAINYGGSFSRETAVRFTCDYWAHSASYLFGLLGGIVLCIWVIMQRRHLSRATVAYSASETKAAGSV